MVSPYSKNVAGDFYVEDQCCTACGVPVETAPDIFAFDNLHCYVKKQPASPDELDRTLLVMGSQDLDCVRYKGGDEDLIRRLVEAGEGQNCDASLRERYSERLRNIARVRFAASSAFSFLNALIADARRLRGYDGKPRYRFRSIVKKGETATVKFAWYGHVFHSIVVETEANGVFVVRLEALLSLAGQGLSRTVHDWLQPLTEASNIRWMTEEEFRNGGGQPRPY